MESWRERGFVPDSDEEDGLGTQDAKETTPTRAFESHLSPLGDGPSTVSGADIAGISNVAGYGDIGTPVSGDGDSNSPQNGIFEMDLTEDGTPQRSKTVEHVPGGNLEERLENTSDDGVKPTRIISLGKNGEDAVPTLPPLPSTPSSRRSDDMFDIPSSSPDELQFVGFPVPRLKAVVSDAQQTTPTMPAPAAPLSESGSSSPLSSPPSFLDMTPQNSPPSQNAREEASPRPQYHLEESRPQVDAQEELPRELGQPARRSLRERNPIQLHPYLLEDAQYQRLMKTRGIRPVHVLSHHGSTERMHTDGSENNTSFNPTDSRCDDPNVDVFFPYPPSPIRAAARKKSPQRAYGHIGGGGRLSAASPTDFEARKAKRPKLSHRKDIRDDSRSRGSMPAFATEVEANSAWDIPDGPTPERSSERENGSSSQATHFSGFRFPRGFTPPVMTTPITEPTPKMTDTDDAVSIDGRDDGNVQNAVDVDLTTTRSESSPDLDEGSKESEAVVRKLQRKIKGVLPASWLRLDLKQQEERSGVQQRSRDLATSHTRPANAKGVARKIARSDSGSFPSPRQRSMHGARPFELEADLIEEEEAEGEKEDDATANTDPLEEFIGPLNDPFDGETVADADIPEDNRVDYMLPPAHGRAVTFGQKGGAKRRRSPQDRSRPTGSKKRPRSKLQSRITDPVYEEKGTKRPSRRPPKLGILDAPDVVGRPKEEQPQFIRVAMRKARSRRNAGRGSPTHKIFSLSSTFDTEETNKHLREWRRGTLPRTRHTESRSAPSMRQPLIDLTNGRDNLEHPEAGKDGSQGAAKASPVETRAVEGNKTARPETSNTAAATSDPTSRVRPSPERGNRWIVQRNIGVMSLSRSVPRPAELQLGDVHRAGFASALFQRSRRYKNNLTLDRFLSENAPSSPRREVAPVKVARESNNSTMTGREQTRPRHQRKRTPIRLDLTADVDDQTYVADQDFDQEPGERPSSGSNVFQQSYTPDFKVVPLYAGTFFRESTFLGSGAFARSLAVLSRDLDRYSGTWSIEVGDQNLRWSSWDDTVSSDLGMIFEVVAKVVEEHVGGTEGVTAGIRADQAYAICWSLIEYVSRHLHFADPVDRTGLVERFVSLCCKLSEQLTAFATDPTGRNVECLVRIACFTLVFANQACQIARHDLVDSRIRDEALDLVTMVSRQLVALVVSDTGLRDIATFLEDNKRCEVRELGIQGDSFMVEAFVITRHVLHSTDGRKACFEATIADSLLHDNSRADVQSLESKWHAVFTTLPLCEIDHFGVAVLGSRFREKNDNWPTVKQLLHSALDGYNADPSGYPASFNNYCRSLFQRCFHLINGWSWRDCKPILDTLFDFFARNALYNLNHEEAFGSPIFLEEFAPNMPLMPRPGEPCFHVFLKIVASGLRFLSNMYDKKKIRNFAWRLLPNHGRVYPKEKPLRQEDLDALRNHHDLLCTLFLAVPEGCRPRLETIRDLVHPATSHRETCNISLQSWIRLVRFKLSTDENVAGLDPFSDWHGYFVTELLKQHTQARVEIESQCGTGAGFSRQLVESTISQNQRQIEALLSIALNGMKGAVTIAPTLEHARRLVSKMPIRAVLSLFNPRLARVNGIVCEALQIVSAYVEKDAPNRRLHVDEDSQEYGDWSGIEALYGHESCAPSPGIEHVEKCFHPTLFRLLSDCFGEDHYPDDTVLLAVVDCWMLVARTLVNHRLRHWDNYVGHYDADSWLMLRTTTQTRKFAPRFLASCIDMDAGFLSECKSQVLDMWMSALVERTSMLKFQHLLTTALLNEDPENPLLKNLPFVRDRETGRVAITLDDFSQRRLSLISSILSNMREHLQDMEDEGGSWELSMKKQEYKELIERMMRSMKANYQELGNGPAESARGAYVDFVQCIVGFLQQYARDINTIDPFFTDPTTFPLPSTDPTYIVARMKSYEPKLCAEKVVRTLAMFIQGVSERAAIDGQQMYLIDQLWSSMTNTYEAGKRGKPTLRAVLIQCIFPAYLEMAFVNGAAWILSRPILQTVSLVFKDLLFNVDTMDPNCVQTVACILSCVFLASYQALRFLTNDPSLFLEPSVLLTTSLFLEMLTSSLPIVDYFDRATSRGEKMIPQIRVFAAFAHFALWHLEGSSARTRDDGVDYGKFSLTQFSDTFSSGHMDSENRLFEATRHSALGELRTYVHDNWSAHQGKYYFTRRGHHQPQEVDIDPLLAARMENSPDKMLKDSIGVFLDVVDDLGLTD